MSIKIIEYNESWKSRWDNFVINSSNGTVFHLQKFFEYHRPGKFTFNHLIFLENNEIIAVLPGAIVNNGYESPIGASYGSIVTHDLKFDLALKIVDELLAYGKVYGFKEITLTSAPMVYETFPNQNLDFALLWRDFKYSLHYISSAIKLEPELDILQRFAPTTRRNVRKYLHDNDLRVEINDRLDEFYPILIENKARHNTKPTHSYEDLIKLRELLPEMQKLFMVYYKDEPIAGSLLFICNKNVSLCFYNMLRYDFQYLKPIQRVMYEVVKWSTENGFKYVDIGVSQDTKVANPMTPSLSLIEFKEKFDAKTIMRNTLRYIY